MTDRFSRFELPIDSPWPAALLYHLHSSLRPDWESPLTVDEVSTLTFDVASSRRYPDAEQISLPPPLMIGASLEESVRQRRTAESFEFGSLTQEELATLLHYGCGVTEPGRLPLRAAPSAGGLYAVDAYAVSLNITSLPQSVYHYTPLDHTLAFVRPSGGVMELWGCLPPGWYGDTPALAVVLAARLPRVQAKYRERGYRFVLQESGHIAQNLTLVATALGLAAAGIGGFFDDPTNALIGVDGQREMSLYAILIGRKPVVTPSHP